MLSASSAAALQASLSAVTDRAETITKTFYRTMFDAQPELLDVFNRGNQANGEQQRALAGAVVAFARHLLGESTVDATRIVERVSHKHVSLGITPDQYTIVARHLLNAIADTLGVAPDTPVIQAWDEVYWLAAVGLIAAEARLYQAAGVDPVHPLRPHRVVARRVEAEDAVSLLLEPEDGDTPDYRPGQYVTVAVELPDGNRQARQYSLSRRPGQPGLRITVRRVRGAHGSPDGAVSGHLHERIRVGDRLRVSHPFGDVALDTDNRPLILASAGIGVTPIAAMVDQVAQAQPHRPVVLVHADRSPSRHALADQLARSVSTLDTVEYLRWYERDADTVGALTGLVDGQRIPVPDGASAYLCGPLPFLHLVRTSLTRRGLPADHIHYEVFGPAQWTITPR